MSVRLRSRAGRAALLTLATLIAAEASGCKSLGPALYPIPLSAPRPIEPEPTRCNADGAPALTQPPLSDRGELIGAADLHIHQFGNLGFGGRVLWGDSYSEQGIGQALRSCGGGKLCLK